MGYKPITCTVPFCIKFKGEKREECPKRWARQDLRERVITYNPSLNPDARGGGANLQPAAWRITALFLLGYISYRKELTIACADGVCDPRQFWQNNRLEKIAPRCPWRKPFRSTRG